MSEVFDDGPTPEQLARGEHERTVAYFDKPGGGKEARSVWRRGDTVVRLFERDKLGGTARANEDAFLAAMRFRRDYDQAELDPQRAAPMDRVAGGAAVQENDRMWAARSRVAAAKKRLGGETSLGWLVVEYVVGKRMTIEEVSERREPSRRPEVLVGALIGALAVLASPPARQSDSRRA